MADDPVDVASVESGENATLLPTLQMDASEPADLPSPMKQEATPTTNGPDTDMIEAAIPLSQPPVSTTPTPTAQRTATPNRAVNGIAEIATPMPTKAASHGAPARRYLNEKVTGVLLDGMKRLAAEQPEDPLRVLGEFLLQKSRELEGA